VAFSVRLPGKPGQMLLSKGTLWVGIQGARPGRPGRLLALDPSSGRVRRTIRLSVSPLRFVTGFGSLWLTGGGGPRYSGVLRLDPSSGRVLRVIRGAHALGSALAATRHGIWVGGADTFPKGHPEKSGVYFVYKIDPRGNAVVKRVRLRSTVIDLVGDDYNFSIGGRNDGGGIVGNLAIRIAEKRKTEQSKGNEHCPENPPVKYDGETAEKKRRNAEIISFFDHVV
jgi:hypothetical protein